MNPQTPSKRFGALTALVLSVILAPLAIADEASDAWVERLEGGWAGQDNLTPLGRMGFAMLYEWQSDGSLVTHSAANAETYIRLRFFKDEEGRWLLEETGAMEGLGKQTHVLVPTAGSGELRRWVHPEDPEYLTIDTGVSETTLYMKVLLRGREHAQFNLNRVPDEELPAFRRALAEARSREPEEASIFVHANDDDVPTSIRRAREAVASRPADATARLELAAALGEAIQTDPMRMGARYAGELLGALKAATELDPELAQAWRGLAYYYMQAPPIAGGSLDKAVLTARRLAELDPAAGEALLEQIDQLR